MDMLSIHSFCHGFHHKWPEHGINHLRPEVHAMKEKRTCPKGELLIPVLNNSILMMRTNSTECNRLSLIGDVLVKTLIRETAIISMIMLGCASSLC
jgi:hypothetical protein